MCRRYSESYLNRLQPDHKFMTGQEELGRFVLKTRWWPSKKLLQNKRKILFRVTETPKISLRRMAAAVGIPKSSIHRLVHNKKLYLYHFNPVQNLLPVDYPTRLQFCLRLSDWISKFFKCCLQPKLHLLVGAFSTSVINIFGTTKTCIY